MVSRKIALAADEELVAQLRDTAIGFHDLRESNETGKRRKLDQLADRKRKLTAELQDRGNDVLMLLVPLLQDDHPGVRLTAASELKEVLPERSIPVLEEVAGLPNLIGFTAQVVLDRLRGIDRFSDGPPPLVP